MDGYFVCDELVVLVHRLRELICHSQAHTQFAVLSSADDISLTYCLPYTGEHALRLFDLPLHHSDAFDRQIIAQGLAENIPVVTCDETFSQYKGLKVIW